MEDKKSRYDEIMEEQDQMEIEVWSSPEFKLLYENKDSYPVAVTLLLVESIATKRGILVADVLNIVARKVLEKGQ